MKKTKKVKRHSGNQVFHRMLNPDIPGIYRHMGTDGTVVIQARNRSTGEWESVEIPQHYLRGLIKGLKNMAKLGLATGIPGVKP